MAEERTTTPLLLPKKEDHANDDDGNYQSQYYDENCPGCKVDKRKAEDPNPPWLHFCFIFFVGLAASLPASFIFPFLYYMIRDFHIAEREEDVSFYAGFEGSAFMVGRMLTAVVWGAVADIYGRKPVMIISTVGVIVCNTLFGLSTSYWMALATRFGLGALCGILGPIRAYAVEVCRKEHQALGLAMVTSSWGIGLVVGPAIGGYLAKPAENFPHVFSPDSVFGRFPYFLVSLVISTIALGVLFVCFWLPETLHSHKTDQMNGQDQSHDVEEVAVCTSDCHDKKSPKAERTFLSWLSLLKNWHLMSAMIAYCVFQLHDMAYAEIFSLWAVSPRDYGGMGLTSVDVGQALAVSGFGLLLSQLLLYPILERAFGPIIVSRFCAVLTVGLLSSYPFIARLSGWRVSVVIDLASMVKNMLSLSIQTGLLLLQNRAVSQRQRGAASGLSLSLMSFAKAVAPAGAGYLLSWSETRLTAHFLPGPHVVFFILNLVEVVGFSMLFKPFLATPSQDSS